MQNIGIIGAGIMGTGIAQVAVEGGYKVKLYDVGPDILSKSLNTMRKSWQKAVDKGKISQEVMKERLDSIDIVSDIAELSDVDLIIEAIAENLDVKKAVFARLDEICTRKYNLCK